MIKKKKAFTLVEIMAVIAVVGILSAVGYVTFNRAWRNNQTDICENDLRDMVSSFNNYFIDYGNIIIKDDINFDNVLTETVNLLNRQYMGSGIAVSSVAADKKSVSLATKHKKDPWGNPYQIVIYTYDGDDRETVSGLVVVYSKGVDGISNAEGYKEGNYGDDVIAVVEPK